MKCSVAILLVALVASIFALSIFAAPVKAQLPVYNPGSECEYVSDICRYFGDGLTSHFHTAAEMTHYQCWFEGRMVMDYLCLWHY